MMGKTNMFYFEMKSFETKTGLNSLGENIFIIYLHERLWQKCLDFVSICPSHMQVTGDVRIVDI